MKTRVTEIFGIQYPIVQGGLAYLAYSELCAAVSNAGGLGQITAMTLGTPERVREEIGKVRELTDKPFGVNFAIGQHEKSYEALLEVAIEEKVAAISVTGGNPKPIFERLKGEDIRTLVLVAGVRQAEKAEELGADAVMAVGQEGGGHIGRDDLGTMVLIPRVVDSVSIPVLASGGIGDGRGLLAALALGAEGVEMGTRFIATRECVHASEAYKEAILKGSESDTIVIKRSIGAPARALRTDYTLDLVEREKQGVTYEDIKDLISGTANRKFIHDGDEQSAFGWAGQVIGLIDDVPTVQQLFDEMITSAQSRLSIMNGMWESAVR
ncbi:nitronate monooxygenase [Aneurinibacillus sp. Ricciae_BoGa-3]|uniref:NAD(P)H-dependent flavin oxidoreductase n=1 Tax=Aneurinibacillus sp. Ricciae_BoGa-3 TaxID=3022697 RepID=UPI0023413691|nr:nitronate monooxygenase [Aneurinibacillus sp. Ricciae_BoGa-3]WCK53119.1 nitronate monooxygenase [Aneurinibacillus sp. Ricciae_BoGa-3]